MKRFVPCFLMFFTLMISLMPLMEVQASGFSDNVLIMTREDDLLNHDFGSNCEDFSGALRIAGSLIFIVKVLLPLVIIFKGSLDLAKVATSGKQEELMKSAKKMGYSVIAAIIIFFVPTIIYTIFGFIDKFNDNLTEDSKICSACIFDPYGDLCESSVEASKTKSSSANRG